MMIEETFEINNDKQDINKLMYYEKIIQKQFNNFYNDDNNKSKKMSFLDDIISSKLMIYKKFEDYAILYKEILNLEKFEMQGKKIEWKIEDDKRYPYIGEERINCIMFNKNNINRIEEYKS